MSDAAARTRVLVVEDSDSFVEALVVSLEREGFDVSVANDGVEALERFEQDHPDLVLLDLMLPRMSGIDVCRTIRARSDVPIIMVTAKSTELDTVVGLEVGADDYVTKPYRLRELVSRMRAVLRRHPVPSAVGARSPGAAEQESLVPAVGKARPDEDATGLSEPRGVPERGDGGGYRRERPSPEDEVLEAGGVRLDVGRHECTVRGEVVRLPLKEFELLEILLLNAGRVVTRDNLIDRVWGMDYVGDTKTLDVHVKRLRSRIEEDPSKPTLITTIRGVGYRFETPGR